MGRSPYPVPAQLPAMFVSSESSWVLLLPLSDEIFKNCITGVHMEAPGQQIWAPIVKPILSFSNYWLPNELSTNPQVSHYVIMGSLEMRMSSMWCRLFWKDTCAHRLLRLLSQALHPGEPGVTAMESIEEGPSACTLSKTSRTQNHRNHYPSIPTAPALWPSPCLSTHIPFITLV